MQYLIFTVVISFLSGLIFFCILFFKIHDNLLSAIRQHRHQLQNLRYEYTTRIAGMELSAYEKLTGPEEVIYDSSKSNMQQDLSGRGTREWDYAAHQFLKHEGKGTHHLKDGAISIQRTNTAGRYELQLNRYAYNNGFGKIPAEPSIKLRKMRVSCEVRKDTASHVLRFVFKGESSQEVLDEKDHVVYSPEWEKINLVFTISANENSYLRIDDLSVLAAPSTIEIRNLVLFEKKLSD